VTYQVIEVEREGQHDRFVIAEPLASVLGEGKVIATFSGQELERTKYARPFDYIDIPDAHYIVLADYVTVEDGTGLVHQAPTFGADDLAVCRKYQLPIINPVKPDGHFIDTVPHVGGKFFKEADKELIRDLRQRGLLFKHTQFEHSYPHCWRCHTVLIYYAQPSWYIRTTAIKDALIRENQRTDWHPETIKTGRYGDWLNNNIDWAVSRNRYWGTPLPIWRCENEHETCVGSLTELGALADKDLTAVDPHRPYVDDITFPCSECSSPMTRVSEVIDCWYDSGAMPFAQWGYPHKEGSQERFEASYPADFICEAIDQTRGWFYTLMTIGTLVFDKSSYKTVLCLGHILDKDGRKMSKHLGNVLEPIPLMNQHGADAVRWYMLAAGSPWSARRVGHDAISDVVRKTLLTYWNTISFFTLYAEASGFTLNSPKGEQGILDRWILSELSELVSHTEAAYENFDSQKSGELIARFIDDLSNWYVRRSRRRFWDGDTAALHTLYRCLKELTLVMAPMVPFITEHAWQALVIQAEENEVESVHLADFPRVKGEDKDLALSDSVRLARRLVELGRAARATSKVKIRQPLGRALISAKGFGLMPTSIKEDIADELNLRELAEIDESHEDLVSVTIKANFKTLGATYGAKVQEIARAIAQLDPISLSRSLKQAGETGKVMITHGSESSEITLNDVIITETPKEGWSVASHAGESIALDLTLSQELIEQGIVREIIRTIQEERKNQNFHVSDRIEITWDAPEEIALAFSRNLAAICDEVLAEQAEQKVLPHENTGDEFPLTLKLRKHQGNG
jgi:isoleucyl-tRNA synthetase